MKPFDAFLRRKELGLSTESEVIMDIVRQMERIRVMDLMTFALDRGLASHATVHKAIKDAIKLEYVKLSPSEGDGRVKFCSLSRKGYRYLEAI